MNARELSTQLAELLRQERHALADFLVALADFDRRRLWRDLGHASLFTFLHRDLGLSTGSAFFRKVATELVQGFPEVVEPIRQGKLCLTTVVELSKVLTRENLPEVLPRFFHLSKQAAKEVAVEIKPEVAPHRVVVTAIRPVVQALPAATPASVDSNATESHPFRPDENVRANSAPPTHEVRLLLATAPQPAPMTAEPKTAELSRVHITVSRAFLRKLDAAREALSHSHPGASEQEILEAGLDLLLARSARRKGLVKAPRIAPAQTAPPRPRSRYIPALVRRAVWTRDQGRCQWPMEDGSVCGSTYRVQLDHIEPFARGGASTPDRLRCLCQPHNDLAARQAFGNPVMDRYTGKAHRDTAPPPAGG
jgi:hypothetical protein